jgi:hypothetical protein
MPRKIIKTPGQVGRSSDEAAVNKASNADFYAAYQVARVIVDPDGGSGTPPTSPTAPGK